MINTNHYYHYELIIRWLSWFLQIIIKTDNSVIKTDNSGDYYQNRYYDYYELIINIIIIDYSY